MKIKTVPSGTRKIDKVSQTFEDDRWARAKCVVTQPCRAVHGMFAM